MHQFHSFPHEHRRIGALPTGVGVREDLPDVRQPERAENRVHHAVQQHVPVGVGVAAAVVGDVDAPDDEGEARLEAVEVEAVADAERECRRLRRRGDRGHGR